MKLKPDFINHCVTSYEKPLTTMMNSKISKICGEPSESGVTVAGEQVFSFAVTKFEPFPLIKYAMHLLNGNNEII